MRAQCIAIPIMTKPDSPPPFLDERRALVALGELAGAAERRAVRDVWDAWRAYCEATDRVDLLLVSPSHEPTPLLPDAAGCRYLLEQVLATARNVDALDAERHWQSAACVMMQMAANAAEHYSVRLRHALSIIRLVSDYNRKGWTDEPMPEVDPDELAACAAKAAHWAQIVAAPLVHFTPVERAVSRARVAVDLTIAGALVGAGVLKRWPTGWSVGEDRGQLELCTICQHVDAHAPDCPIAQLTATRLIATYRDSLKGGAR